MAAAFIDRAPTLHTARLTLDAHRLTDFDAGLHLWTHPDVYRFIGGAPARREDVWARALRYAGHWSLLGFGFWAVREAGSERMIGELGFAEMQREITPSFDGSPEAGWAFAPEAHGKGYATEAMTAAMAWVDERFGPGSRTVCMIAPDNAASFGVAHKLGYQPFAQTTYREHDTTLLERFAPA